jgi:hypothetical protein
LLGRANSYSEEFFYKVGEGALGMSLWNQGGSGLKKFGNHWARGENPLASAGDRTSIAWSSSPQPDTKLTESENGNTWVDTRSEFLLLLNRISSNYKIAVYKQE